MRMRTETFKDTFGRSIRTVYISGPMTGHRDLNRHIFNAEAKRLRGLGYTVINPAEMDDVEDPSYGATYWEVLRKDVIQILTMCDAIVLLPGSIHSGSNGVMVEVTIARNLLIPILESQAISLPLGDEFRDPLPISKNIDNNLTIVSYDD